MPHYRITIMEVDIEQGLDIDVNQDLRDISESVKEHIEEQFGSSTVKTEECGNAIDITFEVAPRPPIRRALPPETIL